MDDTFTLFDHKNTATQFLHYLNNCQIHRWVRREPEYNNFLGHSHQTTQSHFLNIYLPKKDLYLPLHKWDSSTPRKYKVNLIRTLTFCCFRICSSPSLLRSCLNELRKLFLQNGYLAGVVNYNINDFWTAKQTEKSNHHSSQKGNNLSSTLFRGTK